MECLLNSVFDVGVFDRFFMGGGVVMECFWIVLVFDGSY